jgi:hypothetical protein
MRSEPGIVDTVILSESLTEHACQVKVRDEKIPDMGKVASDRAEGSYG